MNKSELMERIEDSIEGRLSNESPLARMTEMYGMLYADFFLALVVADLSQEQLEKIATALGVD